MSGEVECKEKEKLAQSMGEIDNPTIKEMIETAEAFFDVAACFDQLGDRKNSAKNYTLAGEFFMVIDEKDRAAECYGKAVLRNLMADEIEAARVLLDKGKAYGDHFDTFHFRLASDSFSRRITDEFDLLNDENYYKTIDQQDASDQDIQLFDDVPTSSLLERAELEEILIEEEKNFFSDSESISTPGIGITKSYKINSKIDSDKRGRVVDTLISSAKKEVEKKITSNVTAKSTIGGHVKLRRNNLIFSTDESTLQLDPLDNDILLNGESLEDIQLNDFPISFLKTSDQESVNSSGISSEISDILISSKEGPNTDDQKSNKISNEKLLSNQISDDTFEEINVDDLLTQVSDFTSFSEIANKEQNDLENIEIKDVIPLNWQIKGIKTSKDMVLLSQEIDLETGSLIFKWKRDSLRAGEKARIQYVLSKRIQRTIISVIKDQILIRTFYYDIEKSGKIGLIAEIPFQPFSKTKIDFLLIEDVIPPELKVTNIIPQDLSYLQYHTRDGLLFRWIFSNINSDILFDIQYHLIERPLTILINHSFNIKESSDSLLTLTKIVEPLIDVLAHEYLLYYQLEAKNLPEVSINILDSLYPKNVTVELLASNPSWMRPTIRTEGNNQKRYEWRDIEIDGNKIRKFIIRVRADQPLKSVDPDIIIKRSGDLAESIKSEIQEELTVNENVDLRRKMGMSLVQE